MMNPVSVAIPIFSPKDFKELSPVAEGTTSRVYQGKLHGLKVAVKTLKPLDEIEDPSTREHVEKDFENELLINIRLRHPNILLFIGCVRTKKLESLIFEFCEGGRLKCSKYGPSRLQNGLEICSAVARALCFAHGLGILHRDVKPSQVLMHAGVPKLGDWGLATYAGEGGCRTGETGTWEFMAPEVIRNERYGLPADVFSFGVVLYCVITGVDYPYMDKYLTASQAAIGVAKRDLRPTMTSSLPNIVSHIVVSCWAADPEARPAMAQVVSMLEKAENLLSVKTGPSTNGWSSWLWG